MMMQIIFIFCLFAFTRADDVEKRLQTLEQIVLEQSASIRKLENENFQLKSRVNYLEENAKRLIKTAQGDKTEESSFGDSTTYYNNSDQTTATAGEKPVASRINKSGLVEKLKSRNVKRLLEDIEDVAFHVSLHVNKCFNDHQVIEYDTEELDLGNGYNVHDGIYVVPVSGVYVFIWTAVSNYAEYVTTEIVVNGVRKGLSVSDGSSQSLFLSTSTGHVVVRVNAGDHVFVRRDHGRGCTVIGNEHAWPTFSGWRLFA